jgi:hypothetical protein
MSSKFSDRIGVTKVPDVLQVDGMSSALRNSLWNYLLKTIFSGDSKTHKQVSRFICEKYFKLPVDTLPWQDWDQITWLRGFFFNKSFEWHHVYNLIEFIADNCNDMRYQLNPDRFKSEVNQILEEEMAGYRFIGGTLAPISSREEISSITSALATAQEKGLYGTQKHIETALALMARKPDPDYRNSIKESISSIESIAKQLTGEAGGGLEKALSKLDSVVHFHGAFKAGLLSLYGYTSDENGIRHAILEEPNIGFDEAKFILITCSALVNFIISKAAAYGLL